MKLLNQLVTIIALLSVASPVQAIEEPEPLLQAVQIYSQDELLDLIKANKHLERVKADRCQLTRDIKDRAEKMHVPAYQFLYGDMLAWGVCIDKNAELGIHYIRKSAKQGLTAAVEQLGRYYHVGRFVQQNPEHAYKLTYQAAQMGSLKAQFRLVDMHLAKQGSPYDYQQSYRWLFHAIIADKQQHQIAQQKLAELAKLMPAKLVKAAQKVDY